MSLLRNSRVSLRGGPALHSSFSHISTAVRACFRCLTIQKESPSMLCWELVRSFSLWSRAELENLSCEDMSDQLTSYLVYGIETVRKLGTSVRSTRLYANACK